MLDLFVQEFEWPLAVHSLLMQLLSKPHQEVMKTTVLGFLPVNFCMRVLEIAW